MSTVADKVTLYTRYISVNKWVKESIRFLILLAAPLQAFEDADTKKILMKYLRKGTEKVLAKQLLDKIVRLETQKRLSRKRQSSSSPTSSDGSSSSSSASSTSEATSPDSSNAAKKQKLSPLESSIASKKTLPAALGAASRAPIAHCSPALSKRIPMPQTKKTSTNDEERLRLFVERQKAKEEQKKASTTRTKILTETQSIQQLKKTGRRRFF